MVIGAGCHEQLFAVRHVQQPHSQIFRGACHEHFHPVNAQLHKPVQFLTRQAVQMPVGQDSQAAGIVDRTNDVRGLRIGGPYIAGASLSEDVMLEQPAGFPG